MDAQKMRASLEQQRIASANFDIANLLFNPFPKPMYRHHRSSIDRAKICFPNRLTDQGRTLGNDRFTQTAIILLLPGQLITGIGRMNQSRNPLQFQNAANDSSENQTIVGLNQIVRTNRAGDLSSAVDLDQKQSRQLTQSGGLYIEATQPAGW